MAGKIAESSRSAPRRNAVTRVPVIARPESRFEACNKVRPMITGVHHVQITVPKGEEDAAREFYCGTLRLAEVEKPDALKSRGGFWLAVGDRQVHVGTEEGVDRQATKAARRLCRRRHPRLAEEAHALGIRLEEGIPIPGYSRFEFRDPFGNRVEMIQSIS